ncbi:MAG: CBS domain-containing protein [Deltaproteobacteria bacterium]|nr:CBS domain-containing protein [Deltaproteobacteria bacterium]
MLRETLKNEKIQSLIVNPPLVVSRNRTAGEVIQEMQQRKTGCAIIMNGKKLEGIFTDRDALTRIAAKEADLSLPIEKFMTPNPKTLKEQDSIASAIRLMNNGGYRRIPLLDDEGHVKGVLSVRNIVRYLAEHFPHEVFNLPPVPQQLNRAREGA